MLGDAWQYNKADKKIEISPTEDKVEELLGRDPPTSKKDLQSVMGSLNQLAQWILSVKCYVPQMRKMTGLNNRFMWNEEINEEFVKMKQFVKDTIKLSPFS